MQVTHKLDAERVERAGLQVRAFHLLAVAHPAKKIFFSKVMARTCAICLEEFEGRQWSVLRSCGHSFHAACVARALLDNASCPICRTPVPEQDTKRCILKQPGVILAALRATEREVKQMQVEILHLQLRDEHFKERESQLRAEAWHLRSRASSALEAQARMSRKRRAVHDYLQDLWPCVALRPRK
jgi:hypothetical protein